MNHQFYRSYPIWTVVAMRNFNVLEIVQFEQIYQVIVLCPSLRNGNSWQTIPGISFLDRKDVNYTPNNYVGYKLKSQRSKQQMKLLGSFFFFFL